MPSTSLCKTPMSDPKKTNQAFLGILGEVCVAKKCVSRTFSMHLKVPIWKPTLVPKIKIWKEDIRKHRKNPKKSPLKMGKWSSDLNFLGLFPCFPRETIRSPTAGFAMSLWRRGVGHHQQHRGVDQLRGIQTAARSASAMEGDHGISITSWDGENSWVIMVSLWEMISSMVQSMV